MYNKWQVIVKPAYNQSLTHTTHFLAFTQAQNILTASNIYTMMSHIHRHKRTHTTRHMPSQTGDSTREVTGTKALNNKQWIPKSTVCPPALLFVWACLRVGGCCWPSINMSKCIRRAEGSVLPDQPCSFHACLPPHSHLCLMNSHHYREQTLHWPSTKWR